jgi:hypothetical protein
MPMRHVLNNKRGFQTAWRVMGDTRPSKGENAPWVQDPSGFFKE